MSEAPHNEKNVLGGPLLACSFAPLTGFFRDGCCATRGEEGVAHLVCRWCLHVLRWIEAWEAGKAPQVVLEATHENVLQLVPLQALKRHALDLQ